MALASCTLLGPSGYSQLLQEDLHAKPICVGEEFVHWHEPDRAEEALVAALLRLSQRDLMQVLRKLEGKRPGILEDARQLPQKKPLVPGRSAEEEKVLCRPLSPQSPRGVREVFVTAREEPSGLFRQARSSVNFQESSADPTAALERDIMGEAIAAADMSRPVAVQSKARRHPAVGSTARASLDSRATFAGLQMNAEHILEEMAANCPVVQFCASVYYCDEDEGELILDIMRVGDLSQRSEVDYFTEDGSAVGGRDFKSSQGRLVFEPGEAEKEIRIEIINDDDWDTTLEFFVKFNHGVLENAILGQYLWKTRIRIIDDDCFPSNKYRQFLMKEDLEEDDDGEPPTKDPQTGRWRWRKPVTEEVKEDADSGGPAELNKAGLFFEYCKLNWGNDTVRTRTKRAILADQVYNLYSFIHLFLNVFLIDYVLPDSGGVANMEERTGFLVMIFLLHVLPFAGLHMIDQYKVKTLGVGGTSRRTLQVALLRKFLNYDQMSRLSLRNGEFIMALTRDTSMMALQGYGNMLLVTKEVGSLVLMLLYQMVAPYVFNKPFNVLAFLPLLIVPSIMFLFLSYGMGETNKRLQERNRMQDLLANHVDETVSNYGLIADYGRRTRCTEEFEAHVKDFNNANRATNLALLRNRYFAKWLNVIIVSGYIFLGGNKVIHHTQSLGLFLTNIRIFTLIGHAMGTIYDLILEVTEIVPALENVVKHMNMKLDLPRRKSINRKRREQTSLFSTDMKKDTILKEPWPIDKQPLICANLNVNFQTKYEHTEAGGEHNVLVKRGGMLEVQQGTFVCLVGPKGGGKSTLLRVLGGEVLPNPNHISSPSADGAITNGCSDNFHLFLPSHLKVIHVRKAMFFYGSLMDNICYGISRKHADARPDRIKQIFKKLDVDKSVTEHLDQDDHCNWSDVLSEGQCQQLSLVRAFVANPEVLCLHKPTMIFDHLTAEGVTNMFREFVEKKGLCKEDAIPEMQRPRTCIITSAQKVNLQQAHVIFHVSQASGIREVELPSTAGTDSTLAHDMFGELVSFEDTPMAKVS